jgi:hypothetical protein
MPSLTRVEVVGAALLGGLSLALILYAVLVSSSVPFVMHDRHAQWITVPLRVRTTAIYSDRDAPPVAAFRTRFRVEKIPQRAVLHVRALRQLELSLNGRALALAGRDARHWKRASSLEVAERLVAGENHIEVKVANPLGPPLLQLWLDAPGARLATGPGWSVELQEVRVPAVVARDRMRHPAAARLPVPAEVLAHHWPVWAALFAAGAVLAWRRPRWPARLRRVGPEGRAVAAVGVLWLAFYLLHTRTLPLDLGFDAAAHLDYLRLVRDEGRLPLPADGGAVFHPPLFYAVSAALQSVVGAAPGSGVERWLLRILPALCGFGNAVLAGRIARRLFPRQPGLAAGAVLATGLVPMNFVLAAFVSNEPIHALLVGVVLWLGCERLSEPCSSWAGLAVLAGMLGLALLAKLTSLLLLPLLLLFVALKLWLVEGRSPARALGSAAGMLGVVAALAGWFYVRNWQLFGSPLVVNPTLPGGRIRWQVPGFHTPAWYTTFGEALVHPVLSGFASCWDGLYSSFWGDGYGSALVSPEYPNPWWGYDAMAAVALLALPATLLLCIGYGRCVVASLRGEDLGRRLALAFVSTAVYVFAFATVFLTLLQPFYSQAKAFYALGCVAPAGVALAAGFALVDTWAARRGHRALRALLYGSTSALVGAILGFAFG